MYSLFLFLLIVALLFPQSQSGNNIYSNLGRFDNGGGRSNAVTFNGKYSNHGSLAMPFASYMPYQENTIYVHAAGNTVFMDSALKLGAGKVSNVVLSTNGGGYNS